jgi:hypothetical protein
MMNKKTWISATILMPALVWGSGVFAFSDTKGDPAEAKINALQQAGVASGVSKDQFAPKEKTTFAQAAQLIVKGLDLNIDHIRFIKEPKASDYFTRVPDNARYAGAFIIAQLNGLPLAKDVDPAAHPTREEIASLLQKAVERKGDFMVTMQDVILKDEASVAKDRMDAVQFLFKTGIAELDADKRFRPKDPATREEIADMVYEARQFVAKHKGIDDPGNSGTEPGGSACPQPGSDPVTSPVNAEAIKVEVVKTTDEVNKVVLSRGEKPNTGYSIIIDRVEFTAAGEAVIRYTLHDPEPGKMYGQVITTPKAETFISAAYKPVVKLTAEK